MKEIDLNCDMGELGPPQKTNFDEDIMPYISLVMWLVVLIAVIQLLWKQRLKQPSGIMFLLGRNHLIMTEPILEEPPSK